MSNIDKSLACQPLDIECVSDTKTALLPVKTLDNTAVIDCHYLNIINAYINSRTISKANDSISKTNSRGDVSNTHKHIEAGYEAEAVTQRQAETETTDPLTPAIAKYPDLSDTDNRSFLRTLLLCYDRKFTLQNIEWIEHFYRKAGLSVWKFVRGENQGPVPPAGMVGSGVFLAGCSGRAILPEYSGGERI